MNPLVVSAASYVDLQALGNDRTGLKPWPAAVDWALGGAWDSLHWSGLFQSDCARFSRADPLCKLALIAVELLDLRLANLTDVQRADVAVCLGTSFGPLSADCGFLRTGSPSVFTYTLPSTAIGEICIRYKLKGPVRCLVSAGPGENAVVEEAADLLGRGDAAACLCLYCDAIDSSVPAGLSPSPGCNHGLAAAVFIEQPLSDQPGRGLELPAGGGWIDACRRFCVDGQDGNTRV